MPDLDAVLDGDNIDRAPVDRPRGRPKGSKNKPPSKANLAWSRQAFLEFSVPPGSRLCLPASVGAYVRLILFRSRRPIVSSLSVLLDGDLRYPCQYTANVLRGRRPVGQGEWIRIRELVERLEAELEPLPEPEPLPLPEPAPAPAPVPEPPVHRSRQLVNGEVIALVMAGPVLAAGKLPRPAGPHPRHMGRAA